MTGQLEQELATRMRQQADRVPASTDLDLGPGVFRKSRRMRRRRWAASAVVATASLVTVVPSSAQVVNIALEPNGPDIATTAGPAGTAKQSPPPAQVRPVQLDFATLPQGRTLLPWWDGKQRVIHQAAHTTAVQTEVSWFAEVGQGESYAVARATGEQGYSRLYLASAARLDGLEFKTLGRIAVSADGDRIAWTTGAGNSTDTVVTVASAKSGKVIARKRFATAALRAGVGFADDRVVLTNDLRALPSEVWIWRPDTGQVTKTPGRYVLTTSPETGLISVVTDVKQTGSGDGRLCSAIVDTRTSGRSLWRSCDLAPVAISPDGQYALAKPSVTTGTGVTSYSVVHLPTGRKIAEFRADRLDGVRWEPDSRHFVMAAAADGTYALVRCGTDGRCRLLTDPQPYQLSVPFGSPKPYVLGNVADR